jgi:hypothetical protein
MAYGQDAHLIGSRGAQPQRRAKSDQADFAIEVAQARVALPCYNSGGGMIKDE